MKDDWSDAVRDALFDIISEASERLDFEHAKKLAHERVREEIEAGNITPPDDLLTKEIERSLDRADKDAKRAIEEAFDNPLPFAPDEDPIYRVPIRLPENQRRTLGPSVSEDWLDNHQLAEQSFSRALAAIKRTRKRTKQRVSEGLGHTWQEANQLGLFGPFNPDDPGDAS
jgi:hypothetical protein